jgi:hypothetical protein
MMPPLPRADLIMVQASPCAGNRPLRGKNVTQIGKITPMV